jgi:hypothetical protein
VCEDYTSIIRNTLSFIDNANWDRVPKIKKTHFNKVINILEKFSKDSINDAVVYSFLHYFGIGV